MKLYIEPMTIFLQYNEDETSILPKEIFKKAKEGKVELNTSSLTSLQYLGSIHELFVTRKIKKQTHSNYLFEYSFLEHDLKDSLTYIYPTKGITNISISYALDRDVHHERAIHMATAKASKCDMYVMADQYRDINKIEWADDFEMVDLLHKDDIEKALEKLKSL